MRIQPVQGSGMNVGFDASTGSISISNEGNTPFIYVRVNNKIPVDMDDPDDDTDNPDDGNGRNKGYYRYYDFYEVNWDGNNFAKSVGGLYADYATRLTCVKLYAMPHDIDDPSNIANFSGNIGVSGQGLVYLARARGIDQADGREVFEFLRSVDPSSKVVVSVLSSIPFSSNYYSASAVDSQLDLTTPNISSYWARELNNSELIEGRKYVGYFFGASFDPFPDNPETSDSRPVIFVINSSIAGPTGITVVTDITCVGGSQAVTYATLYPSESLYITEDTKKTFISLTDTPQNYIGRANYFVAVNPTGTGLLFTSATPTSSVIPSLSFINLKDVPQSYPLDLVKIPFVGSSGITFNGVSLDQGTGSIVPSRNNLAYAQFSSDIPLVFKLKNDSPAPGPMMYYGTDSNGIKGWYPFP